MQNQAGVTRRTIATSGFDYFVVCLQDATNLAVGVLDPGFPLTIFARSATLAALQICMAKPVAVPCSGGDCGQLAPSHSTPSTYRPFFQRLDDGEINTKSTAPDLPANLKSVPAKGLLHLYFKIGVGFPDSILRDLTTKRFRTSAPA